MQDNVNWRLNSKTEFVVPRSVLECAHLIRHHVEPSYGARVYDESDTQKTFQMRVGNSCEIVGRLETYETDKTHVIAFVYVNAWRILWLPIVALFGAMFLIIGFGDTETIIGIGILLFFIMFVVWFLARTRKRSLALINLVEQTLRQGE